MVPTFVIVAFFVLLNSNSPLAQCVCGRANSRRGRIIDGTNAGVNEYPWMAAIVDTRKAPLPGCGGALISADYVITAAHCTDRYKSSYRGRLRGTMSNLRVVLGDYNFKRNNEANSLTFGVSQIVRNPSYNDRMLNFDYALLRLSGGGVNFGANPQIGPICLPSRYYNAGTSMTAIGWGAERRGSRDSSGDLKKAQVKKISMGSCRRKMSFYTNIRKKILNISGRAITNYMLCAEAERDGTGTCDGDSGGPLMVNNRGTWELVGVTSWGVDCEQKGLPTMYAAIKPVMSWINLNVGSQCRRAGRRKKRLTVTFDDTFNDGVMTFNETIRFS